MTDALAQYYVPSVVVHLSLRFDEELSREIRADMPSPEDVGTDESIPPKASLWPLLSGGAADRFSHIVNIVPTVCSVELPDHRQFGKWSITLPFRQLPVDPRTLRAVGVAIHMGTVAPEDFAAGMVSADTGLKRTSILDTGLGAPWDDTLAMTGVADDIKVDWKDNEVTLSGRDGRGLLADSPLPTGMLAKLNLGLPITEVVKQILQLHPLARDLAANVRWAAADFPDGIPSPGTADGVTRVRMPARGKASARASAGAGGKTSFWDAITQYCYLVGVIPILRGRFLWLRPARGLADQALRAGTEGGGPTPFAGGEARHVSHISPPIRIRRLIFGRDLESVELSRKFTGRHIQPVEVVCVDTSSGTRGKGRLLTARWPPADLASGVAPSGKARAQDTIKVPVHGIRDVDRLKEIARSIFAEVRRGELGGTASTRSLSSFGGNNADPDMLRLRPGDAIELGVAPERVTVHAPMIAEILRWEGRSYEQQVAEVAKRVGSRALAAVIVSTARGQLTQLSPYYYVTTVRYNWRAQSGMEITFDFGGYIQPRITRAEKGAAKQ